MAFALPVFKIDMFAIVIPTRSASSVIVIPRDSRTSSRVTWIEGLDGAIDLFFHRNRIVHVLTNYVGKPNYSRKNKQCR